MVDWLRNECVKLGLCHETYGACIFMMDFYFKTETFISDEFLEIALVMMVISSKINETKILFTRTIAKNNKIDE